MKKSIVMMLAASLLMVSGCDNGKDNLNPDDDPENVLPGEPLIKTITFESAELNAKGYNHLDAEEAVYTELGATFKNFQNYGYVGGAMVSSVSEISNWDSEFAGTPDDRNVITTDKSLPAGAKGSEKFVIFKYNATIGDDYLPEFSFADGEAYTLKSMEVNNTAKLWQICKIGYYSYPGFSKGDYCDMIAIGYDLDGKETGSVRFPLADFRNDRTYICNEWTEIELSQLGHVHTVRFTREASQTLLDIYTYSSNFEVCVDNISFIFPVE